MGRHRHRLAGFADKPRNQNIAGTISASQSPGQAGGNTNIGSLGKNPARGFYERIGFKWIRNWLPYRLSGEALEKLAQG